MWSVVSASELPVQERFDWFSDTLSREVVPTALSTARPAEFQAEAAVLDLGGLRTATLGFSPLDSRRTPALIRRGDPGQYQLGLMRCGTASLAQQRNECEVGPGDILIWDTSRPSDVRTASEDGLVRLAMLQLPREAIPLPTDRLAQLLARRIPGHEGVAAVLTTFVNALENHGGQCSREQLRQLGTTAVDLVAACLAQHLAAEDHLPAEVRTRALLQRIHAFIDHNLADPELTPSAIAARHHISVRTLHQLFRQQGEGESVQARIRRRRLERCRADLARPALSAHPVQVIAARWGFSGPSVFSRTFRRMYGVSPSEFRELSVGA
ncbi:AraC family transcriptional regulator [Streptomyces lavendulae subsp. lavendulae]|uniref:AraC-like ligand-binding domain-containing protein n=1 Tax=Streptomyces virginiae TaxID=1961 RepID=UPI0004BE213C|nr:helix-turn-helix domain-containing protein [Streptomyces virginiae]GLV91362.1 AraC family transcriptional regulator [Streptomyces lavendulae subsp. lavendulae]